MNTESNYIEKIPGTENHYATKDGEIFSTVRSRMRKLKGRPRKKGYLAVVILGRGRLVHRLVLETFVGPCPDGMQTRHLNGSRTDNRLCNLAWGTPKENSQDTKLHGRHKYARGEAHACSKLKEADVVEIKKSVLPRQTLADRFGVTWENINSILTGKSWKHVKP